MPAEQRGEPYKLGRGRYGLRYRDRDGVRRRTKDKFASRTAALNHYRDVIAPQLRGDRPIERHPLDTFADLFLERHVARPRTIETLRERLAHPRRRFGDVDLRELELMTSEIA